MECKCGRLGHAASQEVARREGHPFMGDALVDLLSRLAAGHAGTIAGGGKPLVIGLVGRGIQASRTPWMHEREAARLGIDYSYLLLDFDRLELPDDALTHLVQASRAAGFQGLNITHPFKQAVIPSLDALSPEAAAIGAVNTVVFAKEGAHGYNTDCWGFAESFREAMPGSKLGKVALFGAGGAGAAVGYALMQLGSNALVIRDKDPFRAKDLVARLSLEFPGRVSQSETSWEAVRDADGVVNTTPVGMTKYPGTPFDPALLSAAKWVADVIYFPAETELLRQARATGCRTLPGIGMAIYQAVRAFELFTGQRADRRAMAGHFEAAA